ncbi:MAG TPA: hypothetical protein VHA78_02005 [Candidatus Peribacteraceae bacterium]|nr:hypothetical protein [Candidatus Peribacteraceae bacterium]
MVEKEPNQKEAESKPGLRVLIADSHRDGTFALRLLVKCWGHTAIVAESREELGAAGVIDVALIEPFARSMRGENVVPLLQERNPHAVLLAYTSWGQKEDVRACLEMGFHDHLLKPYEPEKLKALLEDLSYLHDVADPTWLSLYRKARLVRWQTRNNLQKLIDNDQFHRQATQRVHADADAFIGDLHQLQQNAADLRKRYGLPRELG